MRAKYLIRLDDACNTMHRDKWRAIEELLDRRGIRPLVAVVPDNRDPKLAFSDPDPQFWTKVRAWQAKGWTIAMHGHQHVMHPTKARMILPFYERSEFAGLPYEEQANSIRSSWNLFLSEGVTPLVWIAPAHCFDQETVEAIYKETAIRVISDGIAVAPYYQDGFHWIPQQLWEFRRRVWGLWTVCLHPSTMNSQQFSELKEQVEGAFSADIISLAGVSMPLVGRTLIDQFYSAYFWGRRRAYETLARLRSKWAPRVQR